MKRIEREEIPSLADVAEAYGYDMPHLSVVDIGSRWEKEGGEVSKLCCLDLIRFSSANQDDFAPYLNENHTGVIQIDFSEFQFPAQSDLVVQTFGWYYFDNGRCTDYNRFVIDIVKPGRVQPVGRFWMVPVHEDCWDFCHRFVKQDYRGQGLGSAAMELFEKALNEFALETRRNQSVVAEVGQVDALFWFLKNGFGFLDSESEEIGDMVLSLDQRLEIASNEHHPDDHWWIFPKGEVNWEGYQDYTDLKRLGNQRIRMIKGIAPNPGIIDIAIEKLRSFLWKIF